MQILQQPTALCLMTYSKGDRLCTCCHINTLVHTNKLCGKYFIVSARFTSTSLQPTALPCATRLAVRTQCLRFQSICCAYAPVCMRVSEESKDNRMLPQAAHLRKLQLPQHAHLSRLTAVEAHRRVSLIFP